jgi:inositol oxygenase
LDKFIDPSDPDLDLPNSIHAYQTAERIRKKYPNDYEFQITGLIHDLGKVLFKLGEPSWAVVGDTYVLGCELPKTIVYYDTFPKSLKDLKGDGIYNENCGIENLKISFGHDEYLYMVLNSPLNKHKLSKKYLNMIRFHSFYPWHTNNEYKQFMKDKDYNILKNVRDLNKYDLYSKEDIEFKLTDEIKNYYKNLLKKYFPNKLKW